MCKAFSRRMAISEVIADFPVKIRLKEEGET